jgi:hypothetical protein
MIQQEFEWSTKLAETENGLMTPLNNLNKNFNVKAESSFPNNNFNVKAGRRFGLRTIQH